MIIKSQLTEQDYINANFVLLFSRPIFKIVLVIIGLFSLSNMITVILSPNGSISSIIPPLIIILMLPLMTYLAAKRNFKANQRISEIVQYTFDEQTLTIKGESFNSQYSWDKIYKVSQTKNWLLIWQNRQVANPIPKRDVWDGEMQDLKEILMRHNVKNNL